MAERGRAEMFVAVNTLTGQRREFRLTERIAARVSNQMWDYCAGPCKCKVELDGECPKGWPSRFDAATASVTP
jgi:hypothetical protein